MKGEETQVNDAEEEESAETTKTIEHGRGPHDDSKVP